MKRNHESCQIGRSCVVCFFWNVENANSSSIAPFYGTRAILHGGLLRRHPYVYCSDAEGVYIDN